MTTIASALTLGPLWLALVASHSLGGGVPPWGAAAAGQSARAQQWWFLSKRGTKVLPLPCSAQPLVLTYYCGCVVRIELA